MPFSFLPKRIYGSLTEISPKELYCQGIRLLMLDFDNTIVPYTSNEPTAKMALWLKDALDSPLEVCVVSNSRNDRVVKFCKKYGLPCITHANKPGAKGIRVCMDKFSCKPEECALVGDQIYTDVLGANCVGVTSILIPAINNHNFWLKLRHLLEQPWIIVAKKRRVRP